MLDRVEGDPRAFRGERSVVEGDRGRLVLDQRSGVTGGDLADHTLEMAEELGMARQAIRHMAQYRRLTGSRTE